VDWNVININKFVETEEPTMEQRKTKFYEEYLKIPNVISPWYRNIVPIQVIIFLLLVLNHTSGKINTFLKKEIQNFEKVLNKIYFHI